MPAINIITQLKEIVEIRVVELLRQQLGTSDIDVSLFKYEIPPDDKMGHLAFACFPLARLLKKAPPMIAKDLAGNWGKSDQFSRIEAAGPYLNFFFSPDYLASALVRLCIQDDRYGDNESGAGKTLMLEYSSPNTNKPLHLGHGRNNLLGAVLSELLKRSGYSVIKANLVNDRGIHICKSMYAYQQWGKSETPEAAGKKGDKLVGDYYVLYDRKEKENPEILENVKQMLRDWEEGKPEVIKLWKQMNGWVLEGFRETYNRMKVSFDKYYFESETYQGGKEIILNALEKGLCTTEPNGAVAIDLEAEKLGKKILLRGDGTSMYITQDINTTVTKFTDYNLTGCLFVVGNEQDNHFRVLFTVLDKFGYEWANRCEHISYGMITLPEGKMKSREGTVVDLDELMDEMKSMALEEIKARNRTEEVGKKHDLDDTAEAIGQSAIKYFILKTSAGKEISFNPKESLSFEGATGPYLQYTHARICSLLGKARFELTDTAIENHQWNDEEIKLMVDLARFPDVVQSAAMDRNPAFLCSYIYELCRSYNKFYYEHPILKAGDETIVKNRINITRAVKGVLYKSLNILGIEPLERM